MSSCAAASVVYLTRRTVARGNNTSAAAAAADDKDEEESGGGGEEEESAELERASDAIHGNTAHNPKVLWRPKLGNDSWQKVCNNQMSYHT